MAVPPHQRVNKQTDKRLFTLIPIFKISSTFQLCPEFPCQFPVSISLSINIKRSLNFLSKSNILDDQSCKKGKKQPQNVVYDNCLRMAMMRKVIEKPPPKEGIPCQGMESSRWGFRVMRIPVVYTGFVLALKIQEKQKCCQKQSYRIKYCLRKTNSSVQYLDDVD